MSEQGESQDGYADYSNQNCLNLTPTQKKRSGNSGETTAIQMAGASVAFQRHSILKTQYPGYQILQKN